MEGVEARPIFIEPSETPFPFFFHGVGLLPNISCFVNRLTKQWTYIGASMTREVEIDRGYLFKPGPGLSL